MCECWGQPLPITATSLSIGILKFQVSISAKCRPWGHFRFSFLSAVFLLLSKVYLSFQLYSFYFQKYIFSKFSFNCIPFTFKSISFLSAVFLFLSKAYLSFQLYLFYFQKCIFPFSCIPFTFKSISFLSTVFLLLSKVYPSFQTNILPFRRISCLSDEYLVFQMNIFPFRCIPFTFRSNNFLLVVFFFLSFFPLYLNVTIMLKKCYLLMEYLKVARLVKKKLFAICYAG